MIKPCASFKGVGISHHLSVGGAVINPTTAVPLESTPKFDWRMDDPRFKVSICLGTYVSLPKVPVKVKYLRHLSLLRYLVGG